MRSNISSRAIVVALCTLITAPTLPATQDKLVVQLEKAGEDDYARQVNPTISLAHLFPQSDAIGIAVAVVPDPLVPRYRRLYDHAIVAMELGMLRNGYVLDRFYLPWNQNLRSSEDSKHLPASSNDSNGEHQAADPLDPTQGNEGGGGLPFNRGAYGLLLFRCDAWRHVENPRDSAQDGQQSAAIPTRCGFLRGKGTRFRALYIVTDVSTKGVQARALRCVIQRIASQLPHQNGKGEQPTRPDGDCWPWRDKTNEQDEANEHQQRTALNPPPGPATSGPEVGLMSYPVLCKGSPRSSTLLVLGPSFSGAVDSFATASERLAKAGGEITDICLVSSSATDETNNLVNKKERYQHVSYSSLALDDRAKILHIMHLVQTLKGPSIFRAKSASGEEFGGRSTQVAVVYEASTFGNGVCNTRISDPATPDEDLYRQFCDKAIFVPFPANIADIRYGLQHQREQQQREAALKLPATSEHLSLELGAENGSEYPDSQQSDLTSVSTELAMEQILDTLKSVDPPPRFVVVVATDVRDRLFLFDELRARLPGALLIDLEADNLLGHPDFLHASRGALAIASVNLTPWVAFEGLPSTSRKQPYSAWSSDWQRLAAVAVKCMTDADAYANGKADADVSPPGCVRSSDEGRSSHAAIQVVTLEGFKPVSSGFVPDESPGTDLTSASTAAPKRTAARQSIAANFIATDRFFDIAEYGAPFTCLGAALLWVFPLVLPTGAARRSRRVVNVVNIVSYAWCAAYAAAVLRVAWIVHQADYDNSVLWWTVAMLTAGFAGLQFCLFRLRQASGQSQPKYLNVWVPALLAIVAIVMALTPLRWLATMPGTTTQIVDVNALVRLGLDPDSGLAFLLLVAIAAVALLYASIVLATAAAIVNRNSTLLRTAESERQPPRLTRRRGTLHMNPFGLLIAAGLAIAATVLPNLYYNNVRLTIFGEFASFVALAAITATTCCAALLTCTGVGAARRIIAMSQHISLAREVVRGTGGPGLWPLDHTSPCEFPTTPVIATVGFGANFARKLHKTDDLTLWIKLLRGWIYLGRDSSQHRVAVFTLLATEMSLYQWSIAGAVLCTLASVGAVYLFPIEADRLLLLNLVMLVVLGVGAGYMATAFERNEILCTVLCNRHGGRQFSVPLFACICIPFVVFAVAVAIANVPGVVDWGGGLLQLLKTLGLHA